MSDINAHNENHDSGHDHGIHDHHLTPDGVILPSSTPWPAVMSLGIMLLAAGIVTTWIMTVLGALLLLTGAANWLLAFVRDASSVSPLQPGVQEAADVQPHDTPIEKRPAPGTRTMYPDKVFPISAGFKGGIIGAISMVVIAIIYGLISGNGIWYPVNLLAAMLLPDYQTASVSVLTQFSPLALIVGLVIHVIMAPCIAVVLSVVYTMLPKPRWLIGGICGPIIWTAVLYALMFALNPPLSKLMDGGAIVAFTLSQFAYALAIVWMLERSEPIYPEHEDSTVESAGIS